jgi:hypothetical protein
LVPKVHAGFQELFHAQFNCHISFQVSSSGIASRCVETNVAFLRPRAIREPGAKRTPCEIQPGVYLSGLKQDFGGVALTGAPFGRGYARVEFEGQFRFKGCWILAILWAQRGAWMGVGEVGALGF